MRHGNQASLLVFSDSSLNVGKHAKGTKMYTPEEEFLEVSRQHHLQMQTFEVMGGAEVAEIADGDRQ